MYFISKDIFIAYDEIYWRVVYSCNNDPGIDLIINKKLRV